MRIIVVHNFYQDPGGEDTVFTQEVKALAETETVDTLTFKNRKGIVGLIQFFLYPYNIFAALRLRLKIREFQPDIIHIHNIHYASGPILFRTARRLKIPVVFTLHNYRLVCPSATLFYDGKPYIKSIGRTFPWDAVRKGVLNNSSIKTFWTALTYKFHKLLGTWKNVDAYLALTPKAKELILLSGLNIKDKQIIIKPNFIANETDINPGKTGDYYLFLGRLTEEKGIRQLLDAFSQPGMPKLKVIGEGPLKSLLLESKTGNIEYLGFQKNPGEYISKAKAVILPSIWLEGLPMVMLEALCHQKLLLLSNATAARTLIKDGENAFLIDPFNLSEKIKQIDQRKDLDQIAQNGHQLYLERFTKEKVMQRLVEIYREL